MIASIQSTNRFTTNNPIGRSPIPDYFTNNTCSDLLELIFYMKYLIHLKKKLFAYISRGRNKIYFWFENDIQVNESCNASDNQTNTQVRHH